VGREEELEKMERGWKRKGGGVIRARRRKGRRR